MKRCFVNNTKSVRVFCKRQTGPWHTGWVLGCTWDFLWLCIVWMFPWGLRGTKDFWLCYTSADGLCLSCGGVEVQVTCYILHVFTGSSGSVIWTETSVPHSSRLATSTRHPQGFMAAQPLESTLSTSLLSVSRNHG